ncbi:MAG: ankyrin repeat domain-containing protein [Bdellovibrionales bacterium]|nr:ankyrin repeat domain-containing protein [Bdellovibrionales bacterium]
MTRDEYLDQLGLDVNATWEDVQASYARQLEYHLSEVSKGSSRDDAALRAIEEAYSYLTHDPVIQARRVVAVRPAKALVTDPVRDSGSARSHGSASGLLAWLALFGSAFVFLIGALLYLGSKLQNATGAPPAIAADAAWSEELQLLRASSRVTEKRLELLEMELSQLHRQLALQVSHQPIAGQPREEPRAAPAVPSGSFAEDPQLISIPPSAVTERDKLYIIDKHGELSEQVVFYTPPLIDASIRCDLAQAKALVSDGIDINLRDERGDSALAWAVKRNCIPIVKLLLSRGAQINSTSENGFTPYLWARIYRNESMQQLLKSAGADTNIGSYWWRFDEDGKQAYLEESLKAACRDPYAHGCRDSR